MATILDKHGNEQSFLWLIEQFGDVVILPHDLPEPGTLPFEVSVLHERGDIEPGTNPDVAPTVVVTVLDAAGSPLPDVPVVWSWPDAPELAGSGWHGKGFLARTRADGTIDFCMGPGAYYFPPAGGPHAIWIHGGPPVSDLLSGIGMIGGTNHRHLDVTFRQVKSAPPPEEPDVPAAVKALLSIDGDARAVVRAAESIFRLVLIALQALRYNGPCEPK